MEDGRVVEVTDEDDLETEGNNIDCVTDTVICISDNNQLHDETISLDIIEKEACEDEPLIEHNKVDAEQIDDVINDDYTIFMDETDYPSSEIKENWWFNGCTLMKIIALCKS